MRFALAAAAMLALAATLVPTLAADAPQEGVMTVTSFDGVEIEILACKPASASAAAPVPVVLHSHGWGGSRWGSCGNAGAWLADGWGVVSISQRGFGNSGGEAHVQDPEYEGRDNAAVIDRVATFDWVLLEGPGDPVLAAIGGSYGGGYQFMTALTETAATGSTRLDALAPEITWYDLPESLAPQGVVRTAWTTALYVAGAKDVHPGIHEAFAYGVASGQWPDGTVPLVYDVDADFHGNSPVAFVERGVHLDVPVLIGQGLTDNLFNLNQGWKNFERTLTPAARAQSYFVGYNGGHSIPQFVPPATGGSGDPCADAFGGFGALTRAFFDNVLRGGENPMPAAPYSIATIEGACLSLDTLDADVPFPALDVATSTGGGAPQYIELASGPLTLAGIPVVHAKLTTLGLDQRAFLALAKGSSPATARVLDNNMMPVRSLLPQSGAEASIELAGVATTLGAGERLYLVVSPVSDMSAGHASRAPGLIVLEDVTVDVPVV